MAKVAKTRKKLPKKAKASRHLVEDLEDQFHVVQNKISKARDSYLSSHQKEVDAARKKMQTVQKQLIKARKRVAKAAISAKQTGSKTAKNQLKKARAASLLLTESFREARDIMVTKQTRLHAAKPFDRKLAARAKVLAQFEKDWEKKMQAETAARAKRAKKAAAKRRTTAKKRAVKKSTAN